jgi:O-antigen polymerase
MIVTKSFLRQKNWSWLTLLSVLVIAPFYYQPNLGGKGLMIPSNVTVWLIVCFFIWFTSRKILSTSTLNLPSKYIFVLAFPIFATLSGFISDVSEPTVWAFRLLYVWAGTFFLTCLFQLNINRKAEDYLLVVVLIAGLLHALLALIQYFQPQGLTVYLPTAKPVNVAVGMFQQINIQASFQATVVAIGWYLINRPCVTVRPLLMLTVFVTVFFGTYLVMISGSRVGALSLIVSLVLLSAFHRKVIARNKKKIIAMILTMLAAFCLSLFSDGVSRLTDKTVHTEYGASERIGIYKISAELIKQKPLIGHGLGSFGAAWQYQKGKFQEQNPDYELIQTYVSHPHNELLFWQIEGGLLASAGILVTFFTVFVLAWQSKARYVLALLFPLAFHNQVEFPFHTSAYAWIICLLLIFIALNHTKKKQFILSFSSAMRTTLLISNHSLLAIASLFFIHTLLSINELRSATILEGNADLSVPLINPYFSSTAEDFYMQRLFKISGVERAVEGMEVFNHWQQEKIKIRPVQYNFKLLIASYQNLQQQDKACGTAEIAANIYAANQEFKDFKAFCKK